MSGIYGYIKNNNYKESNIPCLDRLSEWNKAYGKDAHLEASGDTYKIGCYVEKLHSKSMRLSKMISRDSKIWSIDAVIYNKSEIFNMTGISNQMSVNEISDEELIVELVEQKGLEALSSVNGDFAGVCFDRELNCVTLFRDHMGIRPLYYYLSNEFICFSTDLRGVLSVESVDVSVNKAWVYRSYFHLIGYTSTSTEYANIYCVRPASYLKVEFEGAPFKNRYPNRIFHAKEYDYEVDDIHTTERFS